MLALLLASGRARARGRALDLGGSHDHDFVRTARANMGREVMRAILDADMPVVGDDH